VANLSKAAWMQQTRLLLKSWVRKNIFLLRILFRFTTTVCSY